ncbi:helix-turn-helix domain-containing protein [Cohnella fermenti]|uniref:Helix-turn-helix transcriptional regulator n=1 Tax=Cohnella fermenti TaxID=2565925 RepID=A0A4S4BVI4_9BACL|nr:AraC family transcriptional regulator [Cohnella fermenti]THF79139.1 helix-turn-helix transcriptional regulator [Cohnella fermenti]
MREPWLKEMRECVGWDASWSQVRRWMTLEGRGEHVDLLCLTAGAAYMQREGPKRQLEVGDFVIGGLSGEALTIIPNGANGCRLLHIRLAVELLPGLPQGGKLLALLYGACGSDTIEASSACTREMRRSAEALADWCGAADHAGASGRILLQYSKLVELLGYLLEGLGEDTAHPAQRNTVYCSARESLFEAVAFIVEHITTDLDMTEIIRTSGLGKTPFYEEFRMLTGMSPRVFIRRLRIQMARRLLCTSNLSVTSIAYECGYRSLNYFHKQFKQQYEVTPREYRKRDRTTG